MESSMHLFMMITRLLFLLSCFHPIMIASSTSKHPPCHNDESAALWQFNQSFFIIDNENVSGDLSAYPKTASWKLEESSDCCSWDGVECDDDTGHVIGLDLSSSFLYGSINSSSCLFRLLRLRKLNLADNHFNLSQIPTTFGHLSRLTFLNLSGSAFSGQVPSELSRLSKLATLDLSANTDYSSSYGLLKLEKPGLSSLIQNPTGLKDLHLSYVNISSAIPDILANFSSLESLSLRDCGLHGEFPSAIFQLQNLQTLSVRFNPYLTGYLPEFNKSSPLQLLFVAGTGFSGKVPDSIGNLKSMNVLDISDCNFSGPVPPSLGNLTQLTFLDLSSNNFSSGTMAWIGKQTKLTYLSLGGVNLTGEIPSSLQNLTQLALLYLYENQLTDQIPSWLANLTQLTKLQLQQNNLHGPIPPSIYRLVNLELLHLNDNNLSGPVDFNMFFNLKKLVILQLSDLDLLFLTNTSINATVPKFKRLVLNACNLSEFPDFLRYQDEMEFLSLDGNKIQGQIPKWMWNVGKETLWCLSVFDNFLTGFDKPPVVLPWTSLRTLNLQSNMLKGSLPIPPPSIVTYSASDNLVTGEISPLICNL